MSESSKRWLCACFVSASFWLSAGVADACSLTESYIPPTNYDLVAHADAIAVARAVSNVREGGVRFRTVDALKGSPPETFIAGHELGRPPFSDPNGLTEPNPEASYGACQRHTYRHDGLYVMFLKLEKGDWQEIDYAYARSNEDYYGDDSVWVRAINAYVKVQRERDGEQELLALRRLRDSYLKQASSGTHDQSWSILADDISYRISPDYTSNPQLPPSISTMLAPRETSRWPWLALIGALTMLASIVGVGWLAFRARQSSADT